MQVITVVAAHFLGSSLIKKNVHSFSKGAKPIDILLLNNSLMGPISI